MKYYTEHGIDITKKIKDGKTELIKGTDIETEINTYNRARLKRRYSYEVYTDCVKTNRRIHIGYGIPS